MKRPLVSVIIPTYNSADLIERAVSSVLSQTFQDFEIIIVDDGSTDNTAQIISRLRKRDPRILYTYSSHSGGAARPKNIGIRMAKAPFIATLDADDEWYPKKLEKQIAILNNHSRPRLGYVTCFALYVYEEEKMKVIYRVPRYKNVLQRILAHDYMGSGSGMIYKKEVFEKVGGFDENLRSGQDTEMRIRLAQYYDFDIIEEVLFIYYFHKGNISNTLGMKRRQEDIAKIMNKWKYLYSKYPKTYSDRLRFNGTMCMINDMTVEARESFLESVKVHPFNWRSYLYFLFSFLGSNFYRKLTYTKARIRHFLGI